MKYVPLDKRSKKEKKHFYQSQRNSNDFNTGTRTFKDSKHPSRATRKRELREKIGE